MGQKSTEINESKENYKVVVGIDFGSSGCGFAYSFMNRDKIYHCDIINKRRNIIIIGFYIIFISSFIYPKFIISRFINKKILIIKNISSPYWGYNGGSLGENFVTPYGGYNGGSLGDDISSPCERYNGSPWGGYIGGPWGEDISLSCGGYKVVPWGEDISSPCGRYNGGLWGEDISSPLGGYNWGL